MKLNKTTNNQTEQNNKVYAAVDWQIAGARVWQREDGEVDITFTLIANGVSIYGCRLVESNDGRLFVGFPARKGKDGKYYNHAFVRLDRETTDGIVNAVMKQACN